MNYLQPVSTNTLTPPARERGSVLVIGLITLLILTIIGVHASRSSTIGTIMANNSQHNAEALALAENSVFLAEQRLIDDIRSGALPAELDNSTTDGFYALGELSIDQFNWDQANGIERQFDDNGNLIAEFVAEFVEDSSLSSLGMGNGTSTNSGSIYRVYGRGMSPQGGTRIVQTVLLVSN